MEVEDIRRLVILVDAVMDELKTIKRRKYFRDYYRKHRNKICAKVKQKQRRILDKSIKNDESVDGYVYFD